MTMLIYLNMKRFRDLPLFVKNYSKVFLRTFVILFTLALVVIALYLYTQLNESKENLNTKTQEIISLQDTLDETGEEIEKIKSEDQYQRNEELTKRINDIEDAYDEAVSSYERILKLKEKTSESFEYDSAFTKILVLLSQRNHEEARSAIDDLNNQIAQEEQKLVSAPAPTIPPSTPESNDPPGSGYSRQSVSTNVGSFLVSLIAGDLGSTRVIVDTASDSDCSDNCPTLSLSDYVSRNGAYAGVNGTYFCPVDYPSCAGKTNIFDLLVMNHKKTYFNSENNVYSANPAVIFGDGYIRFVSAASQWGRDTSPNGVLSNFPLLVSGGNVAFGGDEDPKKGVRAGRSFVANKGNTVYIGVVHSSTVVEAAHALSALGMENAINLDSGGSTALWSGGYRVGPGRNIPNAILFVSK